MKEFTEGYTKEELFEVSIPIIKKENIHYLYFLFDKEQLVYVGQTVDVEARIAHHQANKQFDRYVSLPVSKSIADDEETFYILKFTPKYNKTLSSHAVYQTATQLKKSLSLDGYAMRRLINDKKPRHRLIGGLLYLRVDDLV